MSEENSIQINRSARIISVGFWIIIFMFMSASLLALLTRQIMVKKLHLDNSFVHYVFSGNGKLLNEASRIAGNTVNKPIDWNALYPLSEEQERVGKQNTVAENLQDNNETDFLQEYENKIAEIKGDVSNYANSYHPWQLYMKWVSGGYDRVLMGQEAALAKEGLYVACDEWLYSYSLLGGDSNGYTDEEIQELADSVADFYAYLSDRDIGFLYASATSKPCPFDDKLIVADLVDNGGSNRERFLNALEMRGVPYYNLPQMMPQEPLDWYELYYRTDPHWNDRAGVWASRKLAGYLNENCGFSFNLNRFSFDSYYEDTRPDYFRGQMARRVSPFLWDKEPLIRYIPIFDTEYTITHFSERGIEERNGLFEDVFFNKAVYDALGTMSEKDVYDGTYGDHRFIENDDLYTIVNHSAPDNQDKRILILRDSFTTYVAPYFSTDVGELDLVYMPKFNGSIRTYIEKNKVDAVIMLQSESNIAPKSVQSSIQGYHFDLR